MQPCRYKGGEKVAIKFDKLFALMKVRGMKPHALRHARIVGNATLEKLKNLSDLPKRDGSEKDKNYQGFIDTRTINNICKWLDCQPGEIMEWVPDEPGEAESAEESSEAEIPEAGNDENEGRD